MTGPARAGNGLAVIIALAAVAIGAAPRVALAAGTLPETWRPFVWSDVYATYVDRLAGKGSPYLDTFFEYPSLVGYVAGALALLTRDGTAYVIAWAALSSALAAIVALLVARSAGTRRAILLWSVSPQLVLYGAANFDLLAVAALVAGIVLARAGRSAAAFGALAVGTAAKVFPAAVAPLELARLWRARDRRAVARGAVAFAGVASAVVAPSLLGRHPVTESVGYLAGLTNFDSAWGLVLGALRALGLPGAEEVVALVSTAGIVVTYLFVLVRRPHDDPARLALWGVLAVLLWTRLYSPQYSLWVVALLALAGVSIRTYALLAVADLIVFMTVYPLTLVAWSAADRWPTILFGALAIPIALRHLALVLAFRERPR